ncbi:MAG: carboxylesterase family protein [Pseudomonadota bacterium]|nr:carboxylesterase family protein [Pseudomonadota bacterium]
MHRRSRNVSRGLSRRSVIVGAAALTAGALSGALASESGPEATTKYGRVRGYDDGPIKVFKGVPYGAPTGGAQRWLPPQPPKPWSGVKQTILSGPMSPQNRGSPLAEEAAMSQTGPQSEQCLTVNIFTPAVGARSGKRPVIVWFHGGGFAGGFAAGSGNTASYDGRNLAQKQHVVLVTVTHRLNVFGFLYLGDLFGPRYAQGNVGILDCAAALRWTRENIAGFGGDPDNVTIAGHSGGGAKVTTLMAMPMVKGLFHRAIGESGALVHATPKGEATAAAKRLLEKLGVNTAAALQAVPADRLLEAMDDVRLPTAPVVDGATLPHQPLDRAALEVSRDVPLLAGTLETEATYFPPQMTPLGALDDAQLHEWVKRTTRATDADADNLVTVFRRAYPGRDNSYLFHLVATQASFIQENVMAEAEQKAELGAAPVYVYYFVKHTAVRDGKLRAVHTLEIPYVFDSLAQASPIIGRLTPDEQALADKVSATWAAFARIANPDNPKIPHWPPFDTMSRSIMVIGDEWHAVNDPLRETRLALLELKARTPVFAMPPGGPPAPSGGPPGAMPAPPGLPP